MSAEFASREVVRHYGAWLRERSDLELVNRATQLAATAQPAFWDAVIGALWGARC